MPIEKLGKMRQAFPGHGFQSGFRGFPDRGGGLCIEMTVSDDFNDKFFKKKKRSIKLAQISFLLPLPGSPEEMDFFQWVHPAPFLFHVRHVFGK